MNLPKSGTRSQKSLAKDKLKICAEPGCGNEFYGMYIAKYCPAHSMPCNRTRARRNQHLYAGGYQIIDHHFSESVDMEQACDLPGCNRRFRFKLFNNQTIYHKYCEDHRSEYRRMLSKV